MYNVSSLILAIFFSKFANILPKAYSIYYFAFQSFFCINSFVFIKIKSATLEFLIIVHLFAAAETVLVKLQSLH